MEIIAAKQIQWLCNTRKNWARKGMHIRRGMGAKSKSVRWKKTGHIGPLHTLHRRVIQKPNLLDGKKWGLHAEGTASRERIRLHHFSGSAHSAQIVRSYCAHCTNTYTVVIAQIERNQPAHSVFICFYRPVNSSLTKLISISISCVLFVLPTKYCFSNWEWGLTQLTLYKRSKHPKVFP